jgi:hypothetical protein
MFVPIIHLDQRPVLPISNLVDQIHCNFVNSLFNITYEWKDEESPLTTVWIFGRKNCSFFKNMVSEYMEHPRKTPVKVLISEILESSIKSLIKKDNSISLGFSINDAIIFVNGRIIHVNCSFSDFSTLIDWQSLIHMSEI